MKCLRCLEGNATKFAEAPDGSGAWEMYICDRCCYSWRTTEEEEILNPEKRDPEFQLEGVKMEDLLVLVPVPPLKK